VYGRAALALERYEQAERAFDQYLRQGGEEKSDIFRGRGLARMKRGEHPEAVEDYTRALELAPDAEIYQHRGWAHFFSDAWKLALRDFSKAIELEAREVGAQGPPGAPAPLPPGAGDAFTGRGLARVMLGDYRGAVADAELALGREVRTPEMMHNIACIFAQALARAEADRHEADRRTLAESYRRRALDAVRKTLTLVSPDERVAFWRDKVLPDAALAPLHHEAEFGRLRDEYGSR
jgi:tetratricopeptide (TPR) repeat protein